MSTFFKGYAKRRYDFSVKNFGLSNDPKSLSTVAFGILEELGETMEVVENLINANRFSEVKSLDGYRDDLVKELGDTLCYLGVILNQLECTDDEVDNVTVQFRSHSMEMDMSAFDRCELEHWLELSNLCIRKNLGLSKRLMRGDNVSRKNYLKGLSEVYSLCVTLAPLTGNVITRILYANEAKLEDRLSKKTLKGTGSNR